MAERPSPVSAGLVGRRNCTNRLDSTALMAVEDGGGGDDRIHDDWNGTLVDHFKYGKKN